MAKVYNTTDLRPDQAFERHVFHRDQFAHYLRWTHILKEAKIGESIVDFGCGAANLLEVLYRNKFKQKEYIGIDIREKTIQEAAEKYANVPWAHFYVADLVKNYMDFSKFNADKVCAFEVLEHVGKQNADAFLENFKACGNNNATYYLSTPNYDPSVGAAGNHTYDSGDGRGVDVQEFDHWELEVFLYICRKVSGGQRGHVLEPVDAGTALILGVIAPALGIRFIEEGQQAVIG